jgi:hypothetical protein
VAHKVQGKRLKDKGKRKRKVARYKLGEFAELKFHHPFAVLIRGTEFTELIISFHFLLTPVK